ncbi:MAG: energy-coupling factor transporter transmembrane protein EcfT [Clostridia bacterium]|nr:energy-coupling factor transporter transmembrane protein EcfT [Clostridia bacterium]
MLKDITLGQYFPGETVVHRLDPRTKLIFVLAYIVALFVAKSWISYAVLLAVLAAAVAVSRIPPSTMFRGLKPLTIIIVFTAVINILYNKAGSTLCSFWVITITDAGLIKAGFMIARIMMLILSSLLVTYTTTPMALTDGIELLFNPLKKIGAPVHEFAMMMSIALRFIPTLIEEADKIMSAQKARGADFETGKLLDRAKALLPLLIPLFVSAFRRADELATAMESRCYHGGEGRTRMNTLRFAGADIAVAGFGFLLLAGVITLARFGL